MPVREEMHKKGLTPGDVAVLHLLRDGEARRFSDVAECTGLPGSTLVGVVDRLEAGGFLRRERSCRDRRVVEIRGTPHLLAEVKRLRRSARSRIVPFFACLSPDDLELLVGILKRLHAPKEEGAREG